MKHIFSLVLALVIAMLIVSTISEEVVPEGAAVATQIEGIVRIFTAETPAGRLVRNNDKIAKNDRVEVEGKSRLELRLPDGSYLRLSENARLTMPKLQFEKRTGSLYLQAVLGNGKLWAKIKKRATPGARVEVSTGTSLIAANDTVYSVDAEEDTSTAINVYDGAVLAVWPARDAIRFLGRTGALAEVQAVTVKTFQKVSVYAQEGVSQPQDFDPKATINDWIRWNLQQDAREGLVSITVAPVSATITRGNSLQFSGVAHYPDNIEKDVTWFATWSSSDVKVAKIDLSGVAAGTGLGAATISAAIADMSGSTVLNVNLNLLSIAVTPASRSVINGAVQQFTARGTFSDKMVKDITSSVVWKSSNTGIAAVDARGRAVAGNESGTAVISASFGTKRGTAALKVRRELLSITITPGNATILADATGMGVTTRFAAIGWYSDKTTGDLTARVKWSSSDHNIVEIDQALAGRVIGKDKVGSATIKASLKRLSASGTITVVERSNH